MNPAQANQGALPSDGARVNGTAQPEIKVESRKSTTPARKDDISQAKPPNVSSPFALSAMHPKCIKDFNELITCKLCKGYLIDATTVIECLHSFCRACIVKYFDQESSESRVCPNCKVQIHKTKPKLNIRSDPTLQDIVYKLVPKLYTNEMSRRKAFYAKHPDKAVGLSNEEKGEIHGERLILSTDEQIHLSIEYFPEKSNPYELLPFKNNNSHELNGSNPNQRRYLLCAAGMKVFHLKKFIRLKYGLDPKIEVDFFYKHEFIKDDYTIMDLAYIYSWRRNIPLPLYYAIMEPGAKNDEYILFCSKSNINLANPNKKPTKKRRPRQVDELSQGRATVTHLVSPKPPTLPNKASTPSCSHNSKELNHPIDFLNNIKQQTLAGNVKKCKKMAESANLQEKSTINSCNNKSDAISVDDDSSTDISETSFPIDGSLKKESSADEAVASNASPQNIKSESESEQGRLTIIDDAQTNKSSDQSVSEKEKDSSVPKVNDIPTILTQVEKRHMASVNKENPATVMANSALDNASTQSQVKTFSTSVKTDNSDLKETSFSKNENNENSFETALTNTNLATKASKANEMLGTNVQPLNSISDTNSEPICVNTKIAPGILEDATISKANNESPKSPGAEMQKTLFQRSILIANLGKPQQNDYKKTLVYPATLNNNAQGNSLNLNLDVKLGTSMKPVN